MVAGGMTDVQRRDRPQHVQNGVSADGQDRRQQQDHDAVIRRPSESRTQSLSHSPQGRWRLLLDCVCLPPHPPSASLLPFPKFASIRRGKSVLSATLLGLDGTLPLPCMYTGHASLLARTKRTVLIPSIPAGRLVFV